MHILDAIKALKGGLASEKEAHIVTMTERDEARDALAPTKNALNRCSRALATVNRRAEKAEAELAAVAKELGLEYPAAEAEAPADDAQADDAQADDAQADDAQADDAPATDESPKKK